MKCWLGMRSKHLYQICQARYHTLSDLVFRKYSPTEQDRLSSRIFLANVGANASHRFSGPVFEDGSFEFLPIPEDRELSMPYAVRYRDLQPYNIPKSDLLDYVPRRLWDQTAHNDPEFDTFTYGDNCNTSPRAASLKWIQPGDFLFFISRLQHWIDNRPGITHGFYLLGYLEIEAILANVRSQPDPSIMSRWGHNAHIRRGLSNNDLWDGFWVFAGTPQSKRFRRALPVTRDLAERVFTQADGSAWQWDSGRTDLQVIGSYTRSCRCIIDPQLSRHRTRAEALWDWVDQYI